MTEKASITIDIVSDAVCPWCYIGRQRLGKALDRLPEIDTEIHWRPYQLDPTIPPQGKDRREYLSQKFGGDEKAGEIYARIEQAGNADGISFDFKAIEVSPNTIDAHRVIRWAASAGDGVQDRLVKRLFELYFEEGANIGNHAVLIGAARESGMDTSLVESLLPTDADRDTVSQEIETARRMGISGVPCFLLEGKYAVVGAQDPETLAEAIRKVATAKQEGKLDESVEG